MTAFSSDKLNLCFDQLSVIRFSFLKSLWHKETDCTRIAKKFLQIICKQPSLRFSDGSSTDKSSLLIDGAQYFKRVTRESRRFAILFMFVLTVQSDRFDILSKGKNSQLTSHLDLTHTRPLGLTDYTILYLLLITYRLAFLHPTLCINKKHCWQNLFTTMYVPIPSLIEIILSKNKSNTITFKSVQSVSWWK